MVRRLAVALLPALLLTACESREVEKDLKIVNVHTGWYDAGILSGGQNKLVPSISLELQNVSDRFGRRRHDEANHSAIATRVHGERFPRQDA
jgi:hypothetical protein